MAKMRGCRRDGASFSQSVFQLDQPVGGEMEKRIAVRVEFDCLGKKAGRALISRVRRGVKALVLP